MLRPFKNCEKYRCVTEDISSRYKEGNNSLLNIGEDGSNNDADNRHNFDNSNKIGGNFFSNKYKILLEELSQNKNNSFIRIQKMKN